MWLFELRFNRFKRSLKKHKRFKHYIAVSRTTEKTYNDRIKINSFRVKTYFSDTGRGTLLDNHKIWLDIRLFRGLRLLKINLSQCHINENRNENILSFVIHVKITSKQLDASISSFYFEFSLKLSNYSVQNEIWIVNDFE